MTTTKEEKDYFATLPELHERRSCLSLTALQRCYLEEFGELNARRNWPEWKEREALIECLDLRETLSERHRRRKAVRDELLSLDAPAERFLQSAYSYSAHNDPEPSLAYQPFGDGSLSLGYREDRRRWAKGMPKKVTRYSDNAATRDARSAAPVGRPAKGLNGEKLRLALDAEFTPPERELLLAAARKRGHRSPSDEWLRLRLGRFLCQHTPNRKALSQTLDISTSTLRRLELEVKELLNIDARISALTADVASVKQRLGRVELMTVSEHDEPRDCAVETRSPAGLDWPVLREVRNYVRRTG